MKVKTIIGVDFSGAKLAGKNIWLAEVSTDAMSPTVTDLPPTARPAPATVERIRKAAEVKPGAVGRTQATAEVKPETVERTEATSDAALASATATTRLRLLSLHPLESLASSAERGVALAHLADRILQSTNTLWAIDFPFALPIELACMGKTFVDQLETTRKYAGDAYDFGRWLLAEAKKLGGANHIRRQTDGEAKTPFDCYHYRIICQTFHGMRDVLRAIATNEHTAVLPFQYERLKSASRVVIEACPSTTLKRLGWPHQNYKQPTGGPLTAKRLATRKTLYDGLAGLIDIPPGLKRVIARNPGGDALDAVLAAVGAWRAWEGVDHAAIAAHGRYPLEGYVYG